MDELLHTDIGAYNAADYLGMNGSNPGVALPDLLLAILLVGITIRLLYVGYKHISKGSAKI